MTTTDKPIKRETRSLVRMGRSCLPLVIELHSTYVRVRAKGKRNFYTVTFDQIFNIGARNAAEQLRAARMAERAARKKEGKKERN